MSTALKERISKALAPPVEEKKGKKIKPNDYTTDVDPSATRITIPVTMTKPQAAEELMRQHEEEQKISEYSRVFDGYYYEDVFVAIYKACERHFGWVNSQPTPGFFGSEPPQILNITTQVNPDGSRVTSKAFSGRVIASTWDNAKLDTFAQGRFIAGLVVSAKKMYENQITAFFDVVDTILREESIFKGKYVVVSHAGGQITLSIDHANTSPNIVLNEDADMVVNTLIGSDLKGTKKRIYLFTGPYGNGKTETAVTVGVRAMKSGYTFMYVKEPSKLAEVLLSAKRYMPAVVFMEDIDQVAAGSERSDTINKVLNTLDGAELKGANIKVILTTNHANKLNEAMRRPGRIDIVVQFNNPDMVAKKEIITRMLNAEPGFRSMDLAVCVDKLPDTAGAFIAEICNRARQYGEASGGLTTEIFVSSAVSMQDHIKLMEQPISGGSKLEEAVTTLGTHFFNGNIAPKINEIING